MAAICMYYPSCVGSYRLCLHAMLINEQISLYYPSSSMGTKSGGVSARMLEQHLRAFASMAQEAIAVR